MSDATNTVGDRSPFTRQTIIAHTRIYSESASWPVFATIRWDGKKLSITGVEGPKSNGDAMGSCGQIDSLEAQKHHEQRAPFYTKLMEVWERWHLNDMRAACEHQRAEGWGAESVELVTYGINAAGWEVKRAAEKEVFRAARAGEVANLSDAGRFMIGPDWFKDRFTPPDADSPLSGLYDVKKRETKRTGWVYPHEHPRGVLTKACPTCGYKYGSAWLHEDVPTEVLDFLRSLPDNSALLPATWRRP